MLASRRRNGFLSRLLAGRTRKDHVLVLLEDAAGLEARVVHLEKTGAVVLGEAVRVAPRPDADAAGDASPVAVLLAAALDALGARGETPPPRAVVVSAASLAALLPLPVDPAKPKPSGQMLDMARYELEPAIAAHNSLWTLGEVLAALGALDAAGRAAIAAEMAGNRVGRGDGSLRFGETAIQLGLASREQVDAALAAQHGLQILDSEIACGWRGYMARDADGQTGPHWLAAGLSAGRRRDWLEALEAHGLAAAGFWARAGVAGAWAPAAHLCLALEIWPEQVVRLRLAEGRLAGLASEPRLEQAVNAAWLADQLTDWLAEPIDRVDLLLADVGAAGVDPAALAAELSALLRTEVVVRAAAPEAVLALAGQAAAAEALGQAPRFVAISPRDPQAPLWQRPGMRGRLAAAAVLLALLGWEGHAWWNIHALRAEQAQLEARLRASSSDSAQDQVLEREAKSLDDKAHALRGELARTLARADMLDLLDRRIRDVPALIRALGQAIDPEVVLESVRESSENDPRIGMEVRAWSPDDAKAQAYAAKVQSLVGETGLSVAQADLRSRPGRQGGTGFEVSFWLVPATDLDLVEQGQESGTDLPAAKAAEPTQEARP